MIVTAHVIVINGATPALINEVHKLVKASANGWWHRFAAAWIVGGERPANEWRDLIKPVLSGTTASVLVLRLPNADQPRSWSYCGQHAKDWCQWIHENYLK